MNVYGSYANRVMTAEVSGFQIHGFRGDKAALDAYFAALDVETGTFQPCGRRSPRGSVIAHDPYRRMNNGYPGHDITDPEDFQTFTQFYELDPNYSALPDFLAGLQPDGFPCFLFYNSYEENNSWNCAFSKAVFYLIRGGKVHAIDLLKSYSPGGKIHDTTILSPAEGGIPDPCLPECGVSFLNLQRFSPAGGNCWFFTRLTPLAIPGLRYLMY